MSTEPNKNWEEEFDKKFDCLELDPEIRGIINELKSFIHSTVEEAEEKAFIRGQKHAFGVDKERVREDAVQAERERITKEIQNYYIKSSAHDDSEEVTIPSILTIVSGASNKEE